MVRPPISPKTIHRAANGRFMYFDVDVTDHPFWWNCLDCGGKYQETLAVMTARGDGQTNCPLCKVAANLCSMSGCWEPAPVVCVCECGAHMHTCQSHADLASAEAGHCGLLVHATDLGVPTAC